MVRSRSTAAVLAGLLLVAPLGSSVVAQTKPGEIKGSDVMGDKGRSAQDGWVQAPIPREESASKDAPNPGGHSTQENANRPVPKADTAYTPGSDPQGPLDHRTPGPANANPAAPSK